MKDSNSKGRMKTFCLSKTSRLRGTDCSILFDLCTTLMFVFVAVSDVLREQQLTKARNVGPDAVPMTMMILSLLREGAVNSTVSNKFFRLLSSELKTPGLPSSLYRAKQLEKNIVPCLVCPPSSFQLYRLCCSAFGD